MHSGSSAVQHSIWPVHLLFSFELCSRGQSGNTTTTSAEKPCYFLLNYAWHACPRYLGSPGLLACYFLLNYASLVQEISERVNTWHNTCYFLLNYAVHIHGLCTSVCVRESVPCYFLLNYAQIIEAAIVHEIEKFALLFSFELCFRIHARSQKETRLAIFFWIMPSQITIELVVREILSLAIFFWIMHVNILAG